MVYDIALQDIRCSIQYVFINLYIIHCTAVSGAVPSRHRVPGTNMYMLPHDLQDDEDEDRDPGPTDPNDDADWDFGGGAPPRADPLDPLANFLKELKDLSSMSGPDISDLVSELPLPQEGDVEGMSMEDAVGVSHRILYT